MVERIGRWLAKKAPKREELAENRWMRPFAGRILRSELWRFTRRSVPRGVAIGLIVGIFLMIPGLQIIGAALLSVPFRANIPIAAAMTFLTNPFTTPFLIVASIPVGNLFGFHADKAAITDLYYRSAPISEWVAWLASDAAPAMISGLFIIALAMGGIGYLLAIFVWRWWTGRKWRRRASRSSGPSID